MADSEIETCIRYYEGDLPFYGDYRAYITWNSIFFEDCQSERLKVRENKPLNPLLIEQYSDLIQASSGLFRACSASREKRVTTRIERTYDFLEMKKKGYTIAFTSTSKKNFLSSYQDKEGIVLLEFLLPSGTQCIDFSERLSSYTKADEAEVLLPPWTRIQIEEKEMSDREKKILDINGNPPYGKFLVTACGLQKKEKRLYFKMI